MSPSTISCSPSSSKAVSSLWRKKRKFHRCNNSKLSCQLNYRLTLPPPKCLLKAMRPSASIVKPNSSTKFKSWTHMKFIRSKTWNSKQNLLALMKLIRTQPLTSFMLLMFNKHKGCWIVISKWKNRMFSRPISSKNSLLMSPWKIKLLSRQMHQSLN